MRRCCLVAVLLLTFAGCAKVAQQAGMSEHEMPVSGRGQLLQGSDVRASGFLGDYSQLAPALCSDRGDAGAAGVVPSDVLPVKAAITAVRYATGTEAYYVALSGEIEVSDGASGERVFAAVGARHSFATELKSSEITWDELRDSVTYFAKQWRTRLDHARGVTQG